MSRLFVEPFGCFPWLRRSFEAAISACEKAREWQVALQLLGDISETALKLGIERVESMALRTPEISYYSILYLHNAT